MFTDRDFYRSVLAGALENFDGERLAAMRARHRGNHGIGVDVLHVKQSVCIRRDTVKQSQIDTSIAERVGLAVRASSRLPSASINGNREALAVKLLFCYA